MAQSDRAKGRRTASNNPSDARNNGNTINGIESGSCLANTSLAKSAAYSGTFGLKASRLESVEELKERDAKRNATQKLPVGRAARAAAKAEKARLAEKSRRAALTEDERRAEDEAKEVESLANSIAAGATIGGGSVSAGSAAGGGGAPATMAPRVEATAAHTTNAPGSDVAATTMRKVIAKRLAESKGSVPHFYASVECELDNILAFRKTLAKDYDTKVRTCRRAMRMEV
jgi:pyruvate dehydrogenase E2 component (dihydrolipoamide acetyltransferase)